MTSNLMTLNYIDTFMTRALVLHSYGNKLDSHSWRPRSLTSPAKITFRYKFKKVFLSFNNIPITIVKQSFPFICKSSTHIFNSSLISGYLPCKLKTAKVIQPLYKKENENDPLLQTNTINAYISNHSGKVCL